MPAKKMDFSFLVFKNELQKSFSSNVSYVIFLFLL